MGKNKRHGREHTHAPPPERQRPDAQREQPRTPATPADTPRKRQRRFGHN